MFRFFRFVAINYEYFINNHPIKTNATTGFTIAVGGDLLCQYYEQKYDKRRHNHFETSPFIIDYSRALQMGVIRAIVIVPFITMWYPFLVYASPGKTPFRIFGRVFIDQLFGSPTVVSLVFASNAIIHQDSSTVFLQRLFSQGPSAWIVGLQYWPFIHTINFGFIPLKHQALVAHIASIYWNAILSYYSYVEEDDAIDQIDLAKVV